MQAVAQAVPAAGVSGGCVRCSGTNSSPSAWTWPQSTAPEDGQGWGVECEVNYEPRPLGLPLPQGAATVGYVTAGVPLLVVASLSGSDSVDATTVSFLLREKFKRAKKEELKDRRRVFPGEGGEGEEDGQGARHALAFPFFLRCFFLIKAGEEEKE